MRAAEARNPCSDPRKTRCNQPGDAAPTRLRLFVMQSPNVIRPISGGSAPRLDCAALRVAQPLTFLQLPWAQLDYIRLYHPDGEDVRNVLRSCPAILFLASTGGHASEVEPEETEEIFPLELVNLVSIELHPAHILHEFENARLPSLMHIALEVGPSTLPVLQRLWHGTPSVEELDLMFPTFDDDDDYIDVLDAFAAVPQLRTLVVRLGHLENGMIDTECGRFFNALLVREEKRLLPALTRLFIMLFPGDRTDIRCLNSQFVDMLASRCKILKDGERDTKFGLMLNVYPQGVHREYPEFTNKESRRCEDLVKQDLCQTLCIPTFSFHSH